MNPDMNRYILYSLRYWYYAHLYRRNFNLGLRKACEWGDQDLVEWMIELGANYWQWGLCGACVGGHRDIAELMIEKGADRGWGLWFGLEGACRGKHRDLAEWMIELGARPNSCRLPNHCHPTSSKSNP